jgi:hypothetical protein
MPSENIKSKVWQFIFLQTGLLREIFRVAMRHTKMMFDHQRGRIINLFKENEQPEKKRQKAGAAVAHITSVEESNNPQKATEKIERLRNTIDSLLTIFAHGNLSIAIQTLRNRHVTA